MNYSVIITAGGKGKRMNSNLPKQFMPLNGLPILMHTIQQFYKYDAQIQIVLALPVVHVQTWQNLCKQHSFDIKHEIVEGGKERYHSIKNALTKVNGEIVMVHDAVRPLVNHKTIKNVIEKAKLMGAAVPVLPVNETLRKGSFKSSQHQDRSSFWIVQTPQAFKSELLNKAYKVPFSSSITDDASLVEAIGKQVCLTEGNQENIKITTPYDLRIAECLLEPE